MFLRSHRRHKDGKDHTYWSLVETVRTPDGPRQRPLCYLGELNDTAQARWLKTTAVFNEHGESRQLQLFPSHVELPNGETDVAQVLVDRVRLERTRCFGNGFLGRELWRRLGLDRFCEELLDRPDDPADVPWSQVAAVLAINRLCAPGSELAIEQRWYPATALDDLLGIEDAKINDTRLYRCLDRLLPHKTKLERHLKQRWGELFAAEFDVLLYDLTSSYVEAAALNNPMMQRGYSRDHRPDCKQVVLALIVNTEGFPLSYETCDGNRADVTTLEAVLRMVERKYGQARRVWVFDRGIVSEENLEALRRRQGQYLVGTPCAKLKQFERELLEEGWHQVRPEVEVKLVPTPHGEETYILCRSTARKEKEQAMRSRFSARMEKALRALSKRVAEGGALARGVGGRFDFPPSQTAGRSRAPMHDRPDSLERPRTARPFLVPSGHSITAFAVAVPLSIFYPSYMLWLLFCATSVALSRVVLGLHFLSDVVAGSVIGAGIGYVAYSLAA